MTREPNQPDPIDIDIDRALAALRSAEPPAGMEARILQSLDARTTEAQGAPFVRGPAYGGNANGWGAFRRAWLRGALTGALAATAACAALFFALRPHHVTAPPTTARMIAQSSPAATPVAFNTTSPCVGPTSVRVPHPSSAWAGSAATAAGVPHSSRGPMRDEWDERSSPRSARLIPASFAPSHPAPPAPPTAQERALIQLVRTATPAQLAALNRSADEKSDAEREASFNKFFGPSPELLAADQAQKEALGLDTPTTQPIEVQN